MGIINPHGGSPAKKKRGSGCLGIIAGIFFGWLGLVPAGALLTSTGLGGVVGIPMIFLGAILPWAMGALYGSLHKLVGLCPYCLTENKVSDKEAGFNCRGCARRVLIKNNRFYFLEDNAS